MTIFFIIIWLSILTGGVVWNHWTHRTLRPLIKEMVEHQLKGGGT